MSKEKERSSQESPDDLKKALEDNLSAIEENLQKSKKSPSELKEMMKDKGTRKKAREALSEYEDDDEDDEEGEENEKEKMGDEGDDDSDDADDKGFGGKRKMKKSIESLVDDNEEIIDAVPVLKSFLSIVSRQAEVIEDLSSQVSDLKKSFDESMDLQKSIAAGVKSEGDLLKSLSDEIDSFGAEVPAAPKGQIIPQGSVLEKSFKDREGNTKTYSVPVVQQILLKSFQESGNAALQKEIAKWEMSRYDMRMLSPATLAIVDRNLQAGGDK